MFLGRMGGWDVNETIQCACECAGQAGEITARPEVMGGFLGVIFCVVVAVLFWVFAKY
jgi:hypothetical protein